MWFCYWQNTQICNNLVLLSRKVNFVRSGLSGIQHGLAIARPIITLHRTVQWELQQIDQDLSQYKEGLYSYGDSYCKDKTFVRPSNLYNGNHISIRRHLYIETDHRLSAHERYPIPCPYGWVIGCPLWVFHRPQYNWLMLYLKQLR